MLLPIAFSSNHSCKSYNYCSSKVTYKAICKISCTSLISDSGSSSRSCDSVVPTSKGVSYQSLKGIHKLSIPNSKLCGMQLQRCKYIRNAIYIQKIQPKVWSRYKI